MPSLSPKSPHLFFEPGNKKTWHPHPNHPQTPTKNTRRVFTDRSMEFDPGRNTCSTRDTLLSRKDFEGSLRPRGTSGNGMAKVLSSVKNGRIFCWFCWVFRVRNFICHYICLFGSFGYFPFFGGVILFCVHVCVGSY